MEKKTKRQGKLNRVIVCEGLLAGKKKKDIAVEAGSIASSDSGKCNAVTQVVKSNEFQKFLNKYIPDNRMLLKHRALLDKMETYRTKDEEGNVKIIKTGEIDVGAVSKALELGYKIKGKLHNSSGSSGDTRIFYASKMLINAPR